MRDIKQLARDFASRADFLLVYVAEAHAADEWPVGNPIRYNQPQTIDQRLCIARDFVAEFEIADTGIPLVVDDMRSGIDQSNDVIVAEDNPVDAAYAIWPTRFYVVRGGVVQYKAQPDSTHEYKLGSLRSFLQGCC